MKEEWTKPEIEEYDITERTQLEGLGGDDGPDRGDFPVDGGGGGGGGAAPSS